MWIVAITGFCFGIAFAGVVYRLRMWNNAGKELRARKALEKAVRWMTFLSVVLRCSLPSAVILRENPFICLALRWLICIPICPRIVSCWRKIE